MNDSELMKRLMRTCASARRKPKHTECGVHKKRGFGHLLDLLRESDGLSQQQIANALGIRPQSVSEAISILEKRGLIRKEKCPTDKRKTLIWITQAGIERREDVAVQRRLHAENFFSSLTQEEKESLGRLLEKLDRSLSSEKGEQINDISDGTHA